MQHYPAGIYQRSDAGFTKSLELESLRGLAALLVVWHHMPKWNPALEFTFTRNGFLMVDLFFVLSGFVICNAYQNKLNTWSDVWKFQFLRFGRLYPVHILFLFICVAIEAAKYVAAKSLGIGGANSVSFQDDSWALFFKNIFLIQGISRPQWTGGFNEPSWSISVEFYTYVIFALVVLAFSATRKYIFAGLFAAT